MGCELTVQWISEKSVWAESQADSQCCLLQRCSSPVFPSPPIYSVYPDDLSGKHVAFSGLLSIPYLATLLASSFAASFHPPWLQLFGTLAVLQEAFLFPVSAPWYSLHLLFCLFVRVIPPVLESQINVTSLISMLSAPSLICQLTETPLLLIGQ